MNCMTYIKQMKTPGGYATIPLGVTITRNSKTRTLFLSEKGSGLYRLVKPSLNESKSKCGHGILKQKQAVSRMRPKPYIKGENARQYTYLSECIDDIISMGNPVRIIEAFVDRIDTGSRLYSRHAGLHRQTCLPPSALAEAVHLWLFQQNSFFQKTGTGSPAKC